MIDHSDVMERTCEIADFLTLRHCKRCMIEAIVYPDDPQDCTTYTEEAQGIFNDYYDFLEPIVERKMIVKQRNYGHQQVHWVDDECPICQSNLTRQDFDFPLTMIVCENCFSEFCSEDKEVILNARLVK